MDVYVLQLCLQLMKLLHLIDVIKFFIYHNIDPFQFCLNLQIKSIKCQQIKYFIIELIFNFIKIDQMGRKIKKQKKQESDSDSCTQSIEAILEKKINQQNDIEYLVRFKKLSGSTQQEWKSQNQLAKCTNFAQQLQLFQELSKKKNLLENQSKKIEIKMNQNPSKEQSSVPQKISISKESQKVKPLNSVMSQKLLDTFVKKIIPNEMSQQKRQKSEMKTVLDSQKMQQQKKEASGIKNIQKIKEKPKMFSNFSLIEKIKSIQQIKGYNVTNNQIFYHVDVWDKNGQTMLVPPLQAETVKNLDRMKVALYMQDCLVRATEQQSGTKCSKGTL